MSKPDFDVIIVGGGPSGAVAGIYLSRAGLKTLIVEKKTFPRETLCGEFLSLEVKEHLSDLNIFDRFKNLQPNLITSFQFSTGNKNYRSALPFNGYSIKRSVLDNFLLEEAKASGAEIYQPAEVTCVVKREGCYNLEVKNRVTDLNISSRFLIGAFGKGNLLDKKLNRIFSDIRSGYNGIKFHINKEALSGIDDSCIYIFTGHNIYCGINSVSREEATICFLNKRTGDNESVKTHFKDLVRNNKSLATIFNNQVPDLRELEVYGAGNIYFGSKELVQNGIIMIGDAARVIAPLAGDGIGMAFQSAGIAADIIVKFRNNKTDSSVMERIYKARWNNYFRKRTTVARIVQKIILQERTLKLIPARVVESLIPSIISATRN